jgi:hypothetical protein
MVSFYRQWVWTKRGRVGRHRIGTAVLEAAGALATRLEDHLDKSDHRKPPVAPADNAALSNDQEEA